LELSGSGFYSNNITFINVIITDFVADFTSFYRQILHWLDKIATRYSTEKNWPVAHTEQAKKKKMELSRNMLTTVVTTKPQK